MWIEMRFVVRRGCLEKIHMRDDSSIITSAIEKVLLNFQNYSYVHVRHSENYNKEISNDTLKDAMFIYDRNMKLITTVSK